MPLIPRLTSLWRNLFHKDRVDHECSEEIQAYLDMLTEAKLRQGLSPREARRNALLEVGGVELAALDQDLTDSLGQLTWSPDVSN